MQGSPIFDQYVTSYKVMYSDDGHKFRYVNFKRNPMVIFFLIRVHFEEFLLMSFIYI